MRRPPGKRKKSSRHNRRNRIWNCLALAAAVLALLFAAQTVRLYREKTVSNQKTEEWRQRQQEEQKASFAKERNVIEYQGKTYRRNTYVKAILLMGIDRPETLEETKVAGSGGQADGIFLIAQDTARDKVKLLLIPRDTMTPITLTDLSGNVLGQDIQHLTLAYAYGDGREKSCQYMKEAVTNLLEGLEIDGYMAVSMEALPVFNDAVGGVSVTVTDESLAEANPDFPLGETVLLKGKQAESYIRYRDTGKAQSALVRTERQKSYIQGFAQAAREKARQDEGLVARMAEEAQSYMVTDMEKGQYMDMALAFLGSSQSFGQEDMLTLPGTAVETNLYDEYYPEKEKILPIILEMFYREEG